MEIHVLESLWDSHKTMRNPDKGWFIHHFDNTLKCYGTSHEKDPLTDFPGLDHLYLRLAWSYIEPEEGMFRWEIIDNEIEKWIEAGLSIAFRITCKETHDNQKFATPSWVMKAGAKGQFIPGEGCEVWEPDYGDPLFLNKLEAFHRAFSARYDGQSWLAYIDIGSYGDWGEAHTAYGSKRDWPVEVIVEHLDIHCRCYTRTQLVISDDVAGSRDQTNDDPQKILNAVRERGITLRDDGISVAWFDELYGESTLRNPEYFEPFWRNKPIVLELEHYHLTVKSGCWKNGEPLLCAVKEAHATYAGFHGSPREWLEENREYAGILSNAIGYWFFPKSAAYASDWTNGQRERLRLVWQNKGSAPAYRRYSLYIRITHLERSEESRSIRLEESDCREWMPGCIFGEMYSIEVPKGMASGRHRLSIRMAWEKNGEGRTVELGLKDELRDIDGYYSIGEVDIIDPGSQIITK